MLAVIGVDSVEDLYRDVPAGALLDGPVDLPPHAGEAAVERALGVLAGRNLSPSSVPCFLGAGAYSHHVPAAVDHLIQRGEFLTSYTPYQPEITQGTLQYLFEFQTQVAMLTGMPVANASMYDGASAAAEAVMMANRVTRRSRAIVSGGLHPHYREVMRTHARFSGFELDLRPADPTAAEDLISGLGEDVSCVVVQSPDLFGNLRDLAPLAEACHEVGALLIAVVTEIISLGAVRPPGDMGADIVAAEGQSLGNAPSFGGPHVGLFATRNRYLRQMPGRLVGQTTDQAGRRGWVLTLSTREQHIRREKATSNICTNSGLCALAFTIHLSLLGEAGYGRLAQLNHQAAVELAGALEGIDGVRVITDSFFNEFTLKLDKPAAAVVDALAARGILAGVPLSRFYPGDDALAPLMIVAATETNTEADRDALVDGLREIL